MSWYVWLLIGFSVGAWWQEFCHWKINQAKERLEALRRESEAS